MRRLVVAIVGAVACSLSVAAGAASADPVSKPEFMVSCAGGATYDVVSPENASAGLDLNSTSVLIMVRRGVPLSQLTFCTITGSEGSLSGYFLITPAR